MHLAKDISSLTRALQQCPAAGGPSFVPTMGALHEGHVALLRRAGELARPLVLSIFVNPTQFGPSEDYRAYPRTLEADLVQAQAAGADIVFAPEVAVVYPPGEDLRTPPLPAVATEPGLEDARRPGHFAGVVQVVARLFDLVHPRVAVFGEKDYQQLLVIQAMVAETARREPRRWSGLRIEPHPTVRTSDGLAMSSRNLYLDPSQRRSALGLSRALQSACAANHPATAERLMRDTLAAHDLAVDYAAVRDARSLLAVTSFRNPTRALIAARAGPVRLIDNRAMPLREQGTEGQRD